MKRYITKENTQETFSYFLQKDLSQKFAKEKVAQTISRLSQFSV